jgi:hypothetical protein
MSTIEFPRDPRPDHALPAVPVRRQAFADRPIDLCDPASLVDGGVGPRPATLHRERVIRFVQHPSFRRPAPTRLRAA